MSDAPRLIIFDCDGVLVDSEPISNRVMAAAIQRAGLPITVEEVAEAFQGMRLGEMQREVEARLGRELGVAWLTSFEHARAEAFEHQLEPVRGIAEVLTAARAAGVPFCVGSQASREKMELTLGLTGLRAFFDDGALFSASQVPRGKPHPDVFLLAAETMGSDPGGCIVVEDGPAGVEAARRAGMRVLGFGTGAHRERLASGGARVFGSMAELPRLLGLTAAPSPAVDAPRGGPR